MNITVLVRCEGEEGGRCKYLCRYVQCINSIPFISSSSLLIPSLFGVNITDVPSSDVITLDAIGVIIGRVLESADLCNTPSFFFIYPPYTPPSIPLSLRLLSSLTPTLTLHSSLLSTISSTHHYIPSTPPPSPPSSFPSLFFFPCTLTLNNFP